MAEKIETKKLIKELEEAVKKSKDLVKLTEATNDIYVDMAKVVKKAFEGIDSKTTKGISDFNKVLKTTNDLLEQQEDINRRKIRLTKTLKDQEKRLLEVKKDLNDESNKLKTQNKIVSSSTKETTKEFDKESKSLDKLEKELSQTLKSLRKLGKSEREIEKQTKDTRKEIDKLSKSTKNSGKAFKGSTKDLEKYEASLGDVKKSIDDVGDSLGKAKAAAAIAFIADSVTSNIELSRENQKEADKLAAKAKAVSAALNANAKETASSVAKTVSSTSEAIELTNDLAVNYVEIARERTNLAAMEVGNATGIVSDKEIQDQKDFLIFLKEENNRIRKEIVDQGGNILSGSEDVEKAIDNTIKSAEDSVVVLDKLTDKTHAVDIENNILKRTLSDLTAEQEKLNLISGDGTRALEERRKADEKLIIINAKVAKSIEAIKKGELDIKTITIASQLLAAKIIKTEEEALKITAEQIKLKLKEGGALKVSAKAEEEFTDAVTEYRDAQAESSRTSLEAEQVRSELLSDTLEKNLDILIDGADVIKSTNERILADDNVSNDKKVELLEETTSLMKGSYDAQLKTISDFAIGRINLNSQISVSEKKSLKENVSTSKINELLAIKDATALQKRIRQLGLSEIFEGRTLEVIREKIIAKQDLIETTNDLNKTIAETNEINEDILDQEELLKVLNDETIKTQEELDAALKKLEDERIQNRIDAIDKELEIVGDNSKKEAELNQEKNDLLIEQDQEAADKRIDIEEKRSKKADEIANQYLDWIKKGREERFEKQKEIFEKGIEVIDEVLTSARERRNEELDKEIDGLDERESQIRDAINNGNGDAQSSLAEIEKKQAEAAKEKEKLRKREVRDRILLAGLESFVENDGNIGKTLADVSILVASMAAIPSFFDGTENTGTVANPLDSNGGRMTMLHDNERVMTAKQNAKLGGISNEDLADLGAMHKSGDINRPTIIQQNNKELIAEVKEMTKAVKSIPTQNYNYDSKSKYHEQVLDSKNKREIIKVKAKNIYR